ncbi:NUDIX domain-containing protein [Marivita hallyeonensis]|uniref:8-oxo-dGTP diphosphatase n=1 Tax=Marivita hallyeonensis TaxID=996342 RepID=A0A1M5XRB0_9RHOB|nr:NUDIX hydrolase [Marivita hallyeonensis]SHI02367.1 8-oxo-dGTP diphosphatase [Marivita hallyeonensis]
MTEFGGAKLILFIGPQIVVLKRDHTPGIPWPGRLDLPGGGREGDETAEACVLRETHEEIGLRLEHDHLVWRARYKRGVFFASHLPDGADRDIVFGGEGLGWHLMLPQSFISHRDAVPHFAMMVQRYVTTRPQD